MANAKECDRRGIIYKPPKFGWYYIMEHDTLITNNYDLCSNCRKAFKRWLNEYKQKEDNE